MGLPNDDVIYSYLRKMNPAMKQQIMREIMHQHPPTEPEIVDILRHLDISARRAVMASAGVSLEQSDVAEYLAERTPAEVQGKTSCTKYNWTFFHFPHSKSFHTFVIGFQNLKSNLNE